MTRVIELFFYFVDFFPRPSIFHLIIVIFPRSFPPQFTFVSNPGRCQQSAISNEILNPTPSSFPSFYVPNRLSKVSTYPSLRPPAHPTSIMASFHILDKDSWSKILPFCDAKGALSLTQVVSSKKILSHSKVSIKPASANDYPFSREIRLGRVPIHLTAKALENHINVLINHGKYYLAREGTTKWWWGRRPLFDDDNATLVTIPKSGFEERTKSLLVYEKRGIIVHNYAGQAFHIDDVWPTTTVQALTEMAARQMGLTSTHLSLTFEGRYLNKTPHAPLIDMGLSNGCRVYQRFIVPRGAGTPRIGRLQRTTRSPVPP